MNDSAASRSGARSTGTSGHPRLDALGAWSSASTIEPPRSWVADVGMAGFFLVATVIPYFFLSSLGFFGWQEHWSQLLVGLLLVLPLALRTHYPMVMLALSTIGGIAHIIFLDQPLPALVVVPIQVYSVARWVEDSRKSRLAVIVGAAGSIAGPLSWALGEEPGWTVNVFVLAVLVCAGSVFTPYLVGRRVREATRARLDAEQAAEDQLARAMAEREQAARLSEVRARQQIARELHDVVAHSVSVMVVQAEGGRALAAKKPERAAEVLETIASTGREALTEMRRIVGVLRSDPNEEPEYVPAPRLADIPGMVERTGSRVSLDVRGTPPEVGSSLALTTYRVVQEALTNFLKHAGPAAHATVHLHYLPHRIHLEVRDNGAGATATDDGHGNGLRGMRERVHAMGGTLVTGPHPDGGFCVRADLPIDADRVKSRTPHSGPSDSARRELHDPGLPGR
ncbi:sensor histidine kinase [Granulicoccus phenolivorans]|uniref:sensor histidine kinase n=1 Tax=Granulicoccus phenolivorans TaxID=266854 RepID=UPI00138ACF8C|nr:sensor histidine kinase [Granulicoccus phenolivorans]